MSSFKSADGYRRFYQDATTSTVVAAADSSDVTLITAKTNHTIYVQRIIVYITTDAAQSWSFEDTATTPYKIAEVTTSPGDETRWDFDYGDEGIALTEEKNLVLNMSAAGLAGSVKVYAYHKRTKVAAA